MQDCREKINMDYLAEFDLKISLVDGMLIETGGRFVEFGLPVMAVIPQNLA